MESINGEPIKENAENNRFYQFVNALSLSGAIIALFFTITMVGIFQQQEKVWTTGMTALTTFVTGKKIGELNK
jgi:hypothetical protein